MSFNVNILPSKHSAGMNQMPVSVEFLPSDSYDNWSLITNILFYCREVYSMDPYFDNEIYTEVTTTIDHSFEVGDRVMIFRGEGIGYYNVIRVTATNKFIIDSIFVSYTGSPTTYIGRVISGLRDYNKDYKINFSIDEECVDYLGSRILNGVPYGNDSFNYFLSIGEQYNFIYHFYDNFAGTGGKVGFHAGTWSYSSIDEIPFEVGDEIIIEQDLFEWVYTDNFFSLGNLAFTSSNIHNWEVGDIVTVTGQITEPNYNGDVKVLEVLSNKSIRVDKWFSTSTPVEGGSIFGTPFPQYNTTATITDIYYDTVLGVCILTDLDFAGSSQPIGGKIKLLNGEPFINYTVYDTFGLTAAGFDYQTARLCRFDRPYYTDKLLNEYIGGTSSSKWSTILKQDGTWNRIDKTGLSFIRMRFDQSTTLGYAKVDFYNSNDIYLGSSKLTNVFGYIGIYYNDLGVGLSQMLSNVDRVDLGLFNMATEYDNIWKWNIRWYDTDDNPISTSVKFKLDDDHACDLDVFNLMWLDSYGSYISFPFRYAFTDGKEVDRSQYYKQEGVCNNSSFEVETSERGVFNFYNKSRSKIKLTSGFIEDGENYLFSDLIESTDIYLTSRDTYNDGFYAVTFGEDKIEFKDNRWDNIYYYEPTVYFAYNNYRRNNIIPVGNNKY